MVDVTQPTGWVPLPSTAMGDLAYAVTNNAAKYLLNTWLPTAYPGTGTITFGGTGESSIRPPASAAFALGALVASGNNDAATTGHSDLEVEAAVVRLVSSLAAAHRANGGDWGGPADYPPPTTPGYLGWQEGMWAALTGAAGWLVWDSLGVTGQQDLERLVVHEADRMLSWDVPYWKDRAGVEQFAGDTKADDIGWNAGLLAVAGAMMPGHSRAGLWLSKLVEATLIQTSMPADLDSAADVNGRRPAEVLDGWNVNADGTVVNHQMIHPDYAPLGQPAGYLFAYAAAGLTAPAVLQRNLGLIYGALQLVDFSAPPYELPGGTIYRPGSYEIYYPESTDWGAFRVANFAAWDVLAHQHGWDAGLPVPASTWADLHLQRLSALQARDTTGQTYQDPSEDTYAGREQWVALYAGMTLLALATPPVVTSNENALTLAALNSGEATPPGGLMLSAVQVTLAGTSRPMPAVGVTVSGFHPSLPTTVTVERRVGSDEEWEPVPGMRHWTFTAASYAVDYAAPVGQEVTYRVVVEVGIAPDGEVTSSILVGSTSAWLQDPLNPLTAVECGFGAADADVLPVFAAGAFSEFTRELPSSLKRAVGSALPVGLAGMRQGPSAVPMSILTTSEAQANRLLALLRSAYPLLLRTPAHISGMPRAAYLEVSVKDTRYDDESGELLVEWELVGTQVRAPSAHVLVPRWTYGQVEATWTTYAEALSKGQRYLDWLRDPTPGVVGG